MKKKSKPKPAAPRPRKPPPPRRGKPLTGALIVRCRGLLRDQAFNRSEVRFLLRCEAYLLHRLAGGHGRPPRKGGAA